MIDDEIFEALEGVIGYKLSDEQKLDIKFKEIQFNDHVSTQLNMLTTEQQDSMFFVNESGRVFVSNEVLQSMLVEHLEALHAEGKYQGSATTEFAQTINVFCSAADMFAVQRRGK